MGSSLTMNVHDAETATLVGGFERKRPVLGRFLVSDGNRL
jgi:hypothetical protein